MKKPIFIAVVLILFLSNSTASYQAPLSPEHVLASSVELKTTWTEDELREIAIEMAKKHDVPSTDVVRIMACETPWQMDYDTKTRFYDKNDAQSRLTYNAGQIARHPEWGEVGDRENSWGIVQIHRPGEADGWSDISREEAIDPYFALDFLAEKLSQKKAGLWTCK